MLVACARSACQPAGPMPLAVGTRPTRANCGEQAGALLEQHGPLRAGAGWRGAWAILSSGGFSIDK